jgi:hypothetical protein
MFIWSADARIVSARAGLRPFRHRIVTLYILMLRALTSQNIVIVYVIIIITTH